MKGEDKKYPPASALGDYGSMAGPPDTYEEKGVEGVPQDVGMEHEDQLSATEQGRSDIRDLLGKADKTEDDSGSPESARAA